MKIQTKVVKVETWLPVFSGFYGTIWETDNQEENELQEINDQRKEKGKEPVEWDDVKWAYKEYMLTVSKGVTRHIGVDLKAMGMISGIKFQELRSPKEYNFANDSINVEIELSTENKKNIDAYLTKNLVKFSEYLKDKYTSYSGFISSYSNDLSDWMDEDVLEHAHKLGSILNFILLNEEGEDYEMKIAEDVQGNGGYLYASNFDELVKGE